MCNVRGVIDPNNDNNHFIFGSVDNNKCWKYDYETQTYIEIKPGIPKHSTQKNVDGHQCAYFEINNDKFALIYGGSRFSACYAIYEFNNQKWNDIACQLNDTWFENAKIAKYGLLNKGFGDGLSMITDIFEKNKIHIVGGYRTEFKYGCFTFNHEILSNPNLGARFSYFLYFEKKKLRICAKIIAKKIHTHTYRKTSNKIRTTLRRHMLVTISLFIFFQCYRRK